MTNIRPRHGTHIHAISSETVISPLAEDVVTGCGMVIRDNYTWKTKQPVTCQKCLKKGQETK